MLAGDTLVTISLAGSLFFSISPNEAKGKVILYLLLTLAPVRRRLARCSGRSSTAAGGPGGPWWCSPPSAGRRICPFMARDIHSLLLFPEAFLILVLSKLYLVTRGALVPEMVALTPAPPAPATASEGRAVDEAVTDVRHGEAVGWTRQPDSGPREPVEPGPGDDPTGRPTGRGRRPRPAKPRCGPATPPSTPG